MKQWFSFDGPNGDGFVLHDTEREAQAAAEAGLDAERGEAYEGWDEESVTQICWGKLSAAVVETERRALTEDDPGFGEYDEFVDYALADFPEEKDGKASDVGGV